ncbi:hypothetical protein TNCV_1109571 [Trichonephila clavipes]|nr:hypothetical protein TNCV_1109571 [Trichonephila clavipes]
MSFCLRHPLTRTAVRKISRNGCSKETRVVRDMLVREAFRPNSPGKRGNVEPVLCVGEHCPVEIGSWELCHNWQYVELNNVMNVPLGCLVVVEECTLPPIGGNAIAGPAAPQPFLFESPVRGHLPICLFKPIGLASLMLPTISDWKNRRSAPFVLVPTIIDSSMTKVCLSGLRSSYCVHRKPYEGWDNMSEETNEWTTVETGVFLLLFAVKKRPSGATISRQNEQMNKKIV